MRKRVDTDRPPPVPVTRGSQASSSRRALLRCARQVRRKFRYGARSVSRRTVTALRTAVKPGASVVLAECSDATGGARLGLSRPKVSVRCARWRSPSTPSSRRRPGTTTIADVAELAGVSVPTVSKVINGRADVSAETRRRVEAAIRRARLPAARRARPVGRRCWRSSSTSSRASGRSRSSGASSGSRAAPAGRRPVRDAGPPATGPQLDRGRAGAPSDRRDRRLLGPQRGHARRSCGRAASRSSIVDPTGEPLHDTPSIGATNWNGGLTATRHLLGLGHRRIGVIGGSGLDPVQPRPAGRLSRGDGRGRACPSIRS